LGDEPESVRYTVLGYAKAVLNRGYNDVAVAIIEEFEEPFYGGKTASLYRACANCFKLKKGK
jgi:hypothetical protein